MATLRRRKARVPAPKREVIAKICLLGDARSGKGPLLRPHVYSMFPDKYVPTIGTKVTKKTLSFTRQVGGASKEIRLTLLVWDILGQKQYSRLHPVYYQGANGAIVACDASAPDAVESLRQWTHDFEAVVGRTPLTFVLNEARGTPEDQGKLESLDELARSFEAPVFRLRPGQESQIEALFLDIASRIFDAREAAAVLEGKEAPETLRKGRTWHRRALRRGRSAAPENGPGLGPKSVKESEPVH